ncbi:hypothetical protein Tco_0078533 [Tanacetum coccineum]
MMPFSKGEKFPDPSSHWRNSIVSSMSRFSSFDDPKNVVQESTEVPQLDFQFLDFTLRTILVRHLSLEYFPSVTPKRVQWQTLLGFSNCTPLILKTDSIFSSIELNRPRSAPLKFKRCDCRRSSEKPPGDLDILASGSRLSQLSSAAPRSVRQLQPACPHHLSLICSDDSERLYHLVRRHTISPLEVLLAHVYSGTLSDLISGAYSGQMQPLAGRLPKILDIIPNGNSYPDCPLGGFRHPGDGGECAGGAVHLARRSPAEGGDSEMGSDGDGVVMARSLSTSASGGRDMEVWGRMVILAPMVMSVEGGGITGSVPSGGKTGSSADESPSSSSPSYPSSPPPSKDR